MKLTISFFAAVALSTSFHAANAADPAPPSAAKPVRFILVGDSTMANNSGYGDAFCARVQRSNTCINLARGGRSSGSFRTEGRWDEVEGLLRGSAAYRATYVLIQFGHNDQPGKPGRSTDPATQFPVNLKRYVEETRARGAIPVLLTPLTRRQFVDGRLQNDLVPWADAVRKVAEETGAPLVDLNTSSAAAVQALGPMMSARFAQVPPSPEVAAALLTGTTIPSSTGVTPAPATPVAQAQNNAVVEPLGQARVSFDYTHLGREGADFFAAMVTRDLILAVPALRRVLVP